MSTRVAPGNPEPRELLRHWINPDLFTLHVTMTCLSIASGKCTRNGLQLHLSHQQMEYASDCLATHHEFMTSHSIDISILST
jgi:hypothetical protein